MKKVMHIITGLGDGGAEGVLTRLCLLSNSVEHEVISLIDEGKYGEVLSASGIKVHCLNMNSARPNPFKFIKLIFILRKCKPNVVQTWMYHADLLGGLAAKFAGVHRIFWGIRMTSLEPLESARATKLIVKLCSKLSKWVPNKIICCARGALKVHAELNYIEDKLIYIPNGYDFSRFKPSIELRTLLRKEFKLRNDEFIIGMVGRFDPLKDHKNLFSALNICFEKGIPFKCLLIGTGMTHYNTEVDDMIDLTIKNSVLLLGPRTDIPAIMNSLDLHVLSSCSEGFPNVLAEAMACGTPCVSTNVGDASEIIGSTGFCCPPSNPLCLAENIIKMYEEWFSNNNDWQIRRNASINQVRSNYSIETMVKSFERVWLN